MTLGCLNLAREVAYFFEILIISYLSAFGSDFFYMMRTDAG